MTRQNPPLDEHRARSGRATTEEVEEIRRRHGFAIPTDEALRAVIDFSPNGIVEIGAGLGYWARLLEDRGADVVAFDLHPPPSPHNTWFAGTEPHLEVVGAEATIAADHPERTLLVIWPSKNEGWAAAGSAAFHAAGGSRLAYVGGDHGGRTADDEFHAQMGNVDVCLQCRYGVTTVACICDTEQIWTRTNTIELPHWPGDDDNLHLYVRKDPGRARRPWRGRRNR